MTLDGGNVLSLCVTWIGVMFYLSVLPVPALHRY